MLDASEDAAPLSPTLLARGGVGGVLMGLANLVPGISGGTMLLAVGVYPAFIAAIADTTVLRLRVRSIALLAAVGIPAALAIGLLAGAVKGLVEEQRWAMYSLFIGLTLGGVPLLWRMGRPASPGLVLGALAAFAGMVVMALAGAAGAGAGAGGYLPVMLAGIAASAAMILPGISGGYLLLLLGQYETVLGSIDQLARGLAGSDLALALDALHVVIPLGIGVVLGVVGIANGLRWLLRRFEKPTLGILLGLLLGAVVGLWPFQQAEPPEPGDVLQGRRVTRENAASFEVEDWPLARFEPSAGQVAAALTLCGVGFGATLLLGRLGGTQGQRPRSEA